MASRRSTSPSRRRRRLSPRSRRWRSNRSACSSPPIPTARARRSPGTSRSPWATATTSAGCCSTRSRRTLSGRRSRTRWRSTSAKWTRNRRGACSTGWWATRRRRSCGRASRRVSRRGGCRPSPCASSASARRTSAASCRRSTGPSRPIWRRTASRSRRGSTSSTATNRRSKTRPPPRPSWRTPASCPSASRRWRKGSAAAPRPTDVLGRPDDLKEHLAAKRLKLSQRIWRGFVASQMTPAVFETTKVDFDLGRFVFRATGSRVLFDGYHVLYHEAHEPEEGKTLEDLPPIPPLVEGDVVTVRQITPTQHFTEPPPRFSEASLVKELERLGIGRPSTYASIISTLKNRWYATAKDRRFHPTPQGEIVWRVMKQSFPDVFEVGFTAQMETELDKVEEGDLRWQRGLEDFWGPFSKALAAVELEQLIHGRHDLSGLPKVECPNCSGPLAVKSRRFGPFLPQAQSPAGRFSRPVKDN